MNKEPRLELAFIDRSIEENHIQQRLMDGYINATALCKASNKKLGHYLSNGSTKDFINELSSVIGIPTSALIQSIKGGIPKFQGTWVHPQVAINLAQWASPKFAVQVSGWVFEWMQGNYEINNSIPYHLKRYIMNRTKIPPTHFSVFNEITMALIAPLEEIGYTLPDKLVPDISEGRVFCDWLRKEKNIDPSNFSTYKHEYADGRIVDAKLYPNELLPDFREHFNDVWLLERSIDYFKKKDMSAIPYLQKIVMELPYPQKTEIEQYIKRSDNLNKEKSGNGTFDSIIDRMLGHDPLNDPNDPKNKK